MIAKETTETTTNWEYQQEQSKRESAAEIPSIVGDQKNKKWFSDRRWLTDKEIDWATERLPKNDKFKILPAHQFHYVQEAKRSEAGALFSFSQLTEWNKW